MNVGLAILECDAVIPPLRPRPEIGGRQRWGTCMDVMLGACFKTYPPDKATEG